MALIPATIAILDSEAIDLAGGLPPIIPVQFNPTEYTLTKGAQIAEIAIPGIDSPILQFVAGQNQKLTLDLYFDSTLDGGGTGETAIPVTLRTAMIYQLVKIAPKLHAPPRVKVVWGLGLSFTAIVESVTQKFTMFSPLGVPLRATLSVSFREYKSLEDQLKELNLQSADQTKRHVVLQGERIDGIAAQEYDDPTAWRTIADANPDQIDNLRKLTPGTELWLPPLDAPTGSTTGGSS